MAQHGEVSAIKAAKQSAAMNAAAEASKSQTVSMITKTMAKSNQNTIKLDDFAKRPAKGK